MNELLEMELIEAEETIEAAEVGGRFMIQDLDSANWAFRKLAAIEKKRKEIKELADKEIERIRNWQQQEEKGLNNSKEFFEGLLTEYFVRQKEVDPKFKISTPYGKVSSRKQQPKWNYEDEKVLNWLKENDTELIRIKEEVNKAELKKKYKAVGKEVITEDGGEIVEGITIEERPDSINIKVVEQMAKINEKFIVNLKGKDFVTYEGLLDLAHRMGLVSIKTEMIKFVSDGINDTVIVKAVASTIDKEFHGIGDASPMSVNKMIEPHMIRMAETRAKARALRDLTNVGMTAIEELGDDTEDKPNNKYSNNKKT